MHESPYAWRKSLRGKPLALTVLFCSTLSALFLGCPPDGSVKRLLEKGGQAITFWVDFNADDGGDGSEGSPFNQFETALGSAIGGDTIRFYGDGFTTASEATPYITTALRLEADGGAVRIGVLNASPLVGMTLADAEQAILDAGFTVGTITEEYSETTALGSIIRQNPGIGPGAAVDLVVAVEREQMYLLPGDVPLEIVWIDSGSFMMGHYDGEANSYADEAPQHLVTFAHGFWMGKYELTKAQWTAVMGTTPWEGQANVGHDPDSPAVYVSWNDAQAFVTALNEMSGKTFRLPTEAEWEYACRAGTTTRFYWGDDPNALIDESSVGVDYAWVRGYPGGQDFAYVVGLKLPNAFGLYDMSGNVWEWCQDWYHAEYTGAPSDGSAWESPAGTDRVGRGGGWYSFGSPDWRSARRGMAPPSHSAQGLGFRLAK